MDVSRRTFFKKIGHAATALALPGVAFGVIEGCSTNPMGAVGLERLSTVQGTYQNGVVTIPLGPDSPLSTVGSVALVTFSSGSLLVDHPSADSFTALSSLCPHASCLVSEFDPNGNEFYCPFHGSRFDLNGKVTQGPARRSLTKYQTQREGDQLKVFLS